MNEFSYIVSENGVSVMNLLTGESVRIMKGQYPDDVVDQAHRLVKSKKFGEVFGLTAFSKLKTVELKTAENKYRVRVADGMVMVSENEKAEYPIEGPLVDRILKMVDEGYDVGPMVRFAENLLQNPSETAVSELYLFLENTGLPITDDGHFIAYKIVRDDYTSHYDRTFKNEVGTFVSMDREAVDPVRDRTCSHGLHFCSKEYLNSYGCVGTDEDRLLLVKINPKDVVSIPSDYNNAKGRASGYLIWKDISEENWREKYGATDYTDRSVEYGFDDDWDEEAEEFEDFEEEEDFVYRDDNDVYCDECGSESYTRKGTVTRFGVLCQRFKCKDCGTNFYRDV